MPETYLKLLKRTDGHKIWMLLTVPASDNDRVGGATVLDLPGESIFDQICSEPWMVWREKKDTQQTNKQK